MPANYKYARETATSTLLSAVHDRQRREERGIEKIDLQRARRYGMKEDAKNGRVKYTHGGVVFIYCPRRNRAVTSWKVKDSSESSGTKVATPILLDKYDFGSQVILEDKVRIHNSLAHQMNDSSKVQAKWTSHSVLVVDMSGSMRRDDVNGARCRSDGVWMALARDYVKKPLEDGTRSHFDLISIIVMKDDGATVIFQHQPTTWVLYNKLIDMREWSTYKPSGHGYYIPAIDEAEALLTSNANASCSLSLLFFSDGSPSDRLADRPLIVEKTGKLASKFGRRLSISCIGMAGEAEDFSTLNDMVTEAKQFGAQASFGKPSLDADSLSNIITSLASSLTTSKTEMTELRTGKAKLLRMDIEREKFNTSDYVGTWLDFRSDGPDYVNRCWTWNYSHTNGFVEILDTRCTFCYAEDAQLVCPGCKSYFSCVGCSEQDLGFASHRTRYNNRQSECQQILAKTRMRSLVRKELPSWSISVKDQIFGEGAERIVHKVRFLDSNGEFIGPTMVAKESRFVESLENSYLEQFNYHRAFMRTQDIASNFAKKFNQAMLQIQCHFGEKFQTQLSKLPRIQFIEPMVVELFEGEDEKSILVEQFLEGDYKKFNSNMGYVEDEVKQLVERMKDLGLGGNFADGRIGDGGLDNIEEESEDEEESDDEEDEAIFDSKEATPHTGTYRDIQDAYFPQVLVISPMKRVKGKCSSLTFKGYSRSTMMTQQCMS
mmetsp:Transcript_806/g.1651  ORF Transcript_806/g.1651 Transcript_806/m.1651 type:complete len:716 (-) Transcript_806:901-3048(-)